MTGHLEVAPPEPGAAWPVLTDATRAALREILVHGVLSRAEIARALGLSRASLTRAVRTLQEHGFVIEVGTGARGHRRPSELLRASAGAWSSSGQADAGPLYAAVTDLGGRVLALHEEALRDTEPEALVAQVAEVVRAPTGVRRRSARSGCPYRRRRHARRITVVEVSSSSGGATCRSRSARGGDRLVTHTSNDVDALTAKEHWIGPAPASGRWRS